MLQVPILTLHTTTLKYEMHNYKACNTDIYTKARTILHGMKSSLSLLLALIFLLFLTHEMNP